MIPDSIWIRSFVSLIRIRMESHDHCRCQQLDLSFHFLIFWTYSWDQPWACVTEFNRNSHLKLTWRQILAGRRVNLVQRVVCEHCTPMADLDGFATQRTNTHVVLFSNFTWLCVCCSSLSVSFTFFVSNKFYVIPARVGSDVACNRALNL